MRRTSSHKLLAGSVEAPVRLAELPCCRCGARGVTIVVMGRDDGGAHERAWCGPACARTDGWPALALPRRGRPIESSAVVHETGSGRSVRRRHENAYHPLAGDLFAWASYPTPTSPR